MSADSIHPLLLKIYRQREITSTKELSVSLAALLPFQSLLQINEAVICLIDAIKRQRRILVVGDFDVDGATSTAVALRALSAMGAEQVEFLVPDRFIYGYGLTPGIVELAAREKKPDLIITVDNGIASIAGVAKARSLGVDVLVTDHHLPGDKLPEDCIIVNPNQPGDTFPSKHLAGVGVIFYVMIALRAALREEDFFNQSGIAEPNLANLLDLVALGTVADVAVLDSNNRILVSQGLQRMNQGKLCAGIRALLQVSQRGEGLPIVSADLGFAVGPRLNAAGRLDDMSLGIWCLLTDDMSQAHQMAVELDQLNKERRAIESDMQQQAMRAVDRLELSKEIPMAMALYEPGWHQGIVGLVASKIKERVYRPVVAFAPTDDGFLKGSGRSIPGLHIRDALQMVDAAYPGVIEKFGGHAMAAGLSIKQENLTVFRQAFAWAAEQMLSAEALNNHVYTDGELQPEEMTLPMAELLRHAAPWGQGFPAPLFDGEFVVLDQRLVGEKHLRLSLMHQQSGRRFNGIAFYIDLAKWPNERCEQVKIAYQLDVNYYQGRCQLQFLIEEIQAIS